MIKLITDNDLDGNACAIVAHILLNEDVDVTKSGPMKVNEDVKNAINNHDMYSHIFITDLSVNKDTAKALDTISDKVTLLDHHISAEFLNGYSWATVSVKLNERNTCGAELFLDYLYHNLNQTNISNKNKIFDFVEIVRKYDTWEWKNVYNDEVPKQMNDLMRIKGKDDFVEDMVTKINSGCEAFSPLDVALLKYKQKEIDEYIDKKDKQIVEKKILGYTAGVVFAENFISELGNELSTRHPEFDFIAIITGKSVSYRTNKDNVNLSKVAGYFGGGGHIKASGSGIDSKISNRYIASIFKVSFIDKIFKKF